MQATRDSRSAIRRARFFLDLAITQSVNARVEFEAFLEAAIIFARSALHRFKSRHEKHKGFQKWWDSILNDSSVRFFRTERNWILKEGPPKIGQRISMPSIGPSNAPLSAPSPARASGLYYFDDPATPATDTVSQHLESLENLLANAESQFIAP